MIDTTVKELNIKTSVEQLLNTSDVKEQEQLLNEIHKYFESLTEISGFDTKIEHLAAIPTAKGKALGLNHAAQCLLDYKRTTKFVTAILQAIKQKQKQQPNNTIHIFYAGCGPYAPFVTLIAPFFTNDELQFSVLEINEASLNSTKKLIGNLGLGSFVANYYLADAVTFEVPNANQFNILISETLDALLYRECYVPILYNLIPQFDQEIAIIPENVLIELSTATHPQQDIHCKEKRVDTIVNVRQTMQSLDSQTTIPAIFTRKEIDLNSLDITLYPYLFLDTRVHIYDNIWLERNESSLTILLELNVKSATQKNSITFAYHTSPDIELKCELK